MNMGAKKDVDQGYAWVVLVGAFLMYLLTVGSVKAYGVLYAEFLAYYKSGSGNTAWIGSIILLLMFGSDFYLPRGNALCELAFGYRPFSNFFSQKFSFRIVTFLGGIFLGVGYVSTGFIPRLEFMYLTFGIVVGLGYGLAFSPCSTIVSFYFEKRRALANGIVVSASGIGAIGFPYLYRFLIDKFGLQWALTIVGAILLNVCVGACTFRQPALFVRKKPKKKDKEQNVSDHSVESAKLINGKSNRDNSGNKETEEDSKPKCCASGPNFKFSLFKNGRFTIAILAFMFCLNGYGVNLILIPAHIQALGYGKDKIVLAVAVMGACEILARIFMGWFADLELIRRKYIFIICMFVGGISAFIAPFIHNVYFIISYAAIIGIFPGSFWSMAAVLLIDVVGMKDFSAAFGLLSLGLAVSGFICQPVAGWLEDLTGSWNASFYFSGAFMILSAVMYLAEPLLLRCCGQAVKEEHEGVVMRDIHGRQTNRDTSSLIDDHNMSTDSIRTSRLLPATPPFDAEKKDNFLAPVIDLDDV